MARLELEVNLASINTLILIKINVLNFKNREKKSKWKVKCRIYIKLWKTFQMRGEVFKYLPPQKSLSKNVIVFFKLIMLANLTLKIWSIAQTATVRR